MKNQEEIWILLGFIKRAFHLLGDMQVTEFSLILTADIHGSKFKTCKYTFPLQSPKHNILNEAELVVLIWLLLLLLFFFLLLLLLLIQHFILVSKTYFFELSSG